MLDEFSILLFHSHPCHKDYIKASLPLLPHPTHSCFSLVHCTLVHTQTWGPDPTNEWLTVCLSTCPSALKPMHSAAGCSPRHSNRAANGDAHIPRGKPHWGLHHPPCGRYCSFALLQPLLAIMWSPKFSPQQTLSSYIGLFTQLLQVHVCLNRCAAFLLHIYAMHINVPKPHSACFGLAQLHAGVGKDSCNSAACLSMSV